MQWLKHLGDLALNRKTLNRVLTEIELERLSRSINKNPKRVLIPGGGKRGGSEYSFLRSGEAYTTITININKASCPHVVADLTVPWPFKDGVFDAVVSTWVLEHIKDPWLFFNEAHRVLVQEGFLVLAIPFIHRKHGSPFDFWRFTDTALFHLAQSAGFKEVKVKGVGGTPFLCVVALLWPFFRIPAFGALLVLGAYFMDYILLGISRFLGKGLELVEAYPISYILFACKKRECLGV